MHSHSCILAKVSCSLNPMAKEDLPFGTQLQRARECAGLNKNQLARELGTSWQHVDNWERGRVQPSLASVRRLAELLGVSSDFLLGLVDEPATRGASPLDRYLLGVAPSDLTPIEEQWLRDAPVDHAALAPRAYGDLLESLRKASTSKQKPPKSGIRGKVDQASVQRAVEKKREPKKRAARSSLSHELDREAVGRAVRKKRGE